MAYIKGNPVDGLKQTITRHLFLMATVAVALSGLMLAVSENPRGELAAIAAITLACTGFIAVVACRSNPLALTLLFNPARYNKAATEEESVIGHLERLSDRCYVFNGLTVELFRIDHLVISPWGIFVMGRVRKEGELRMTHGTLHAGTASLDNLCTNTWRVCHLLNIVIRKGWGEEVMPFPVIVPHNAHPTELTTVDGMAIVASGHLTRHIEAGRDEALSDVLVDSVAAYILKRYTA